MSRITFAGGHFEIIKDLGSGVSGLVKMGLNTKGESFALKLISPDLVAREKLLLEVEIMKTIDHPHVAKLFDFQEAAVYQHNTCHMLVIELVHGGELTDYLQYAGHFDDTLARTYFHQLMSALEACHALNIFHRDVKPANVLLTNRFQLKLVDWGYSAQTTNPGALLMSQVGTIDHAAPEIFQQTPSYAGASADIWSAACLLFELLCALTPFTKATVEDGYFRAISQNNYIQFWKWHMRFAPHMKDNEAARNFLDKLFVPDPSQRLTLPQMKEESWFNLPTLSSEQLYDVMSGRKVLVQECKRKEREEVQHEAIQRETESKDAVYRTGNAIQFNSLKAETAQEVTFRSNLGQNILYSSLPPDVFVHAIHRFCLSLDAAASCEAAAATSDSSPQAKHLRLMLPGETVEIEDEDISFQTAPSRVDVMLYAHTLFVSETVSISAVDFVFNKGNKFIFQKFFRALLDCNIGADKSVRVEFLELGDSVEMF